MYMYILHLVEVFILSVLFYGFTRWWFPLPCLTTKWYWWVYQWSPTLCMNFVLILPLCHITISHFIDDGKSWEPLIIWRFANWKSANFIARWIIFIIKGPWFIAMWNNLVGYVAETLLCKDGAPLSSNSGTEIGKTIDLCLKMGDLSFMKTSLFVDHSPIEKIVLHPSSHGFLDFIIFPWKIGVSSRIP